MFSPLYMGTNHMLGIDNYVPLTTNNFEIRIYNMDGTNPTENSSLLTLSTDSIGEIQEEQDEIVVHYGNGSIKFPSKVTYNSVTWTLNCYCEPNVIGELRKWRNLVFDQATERMGLPSQYMRDCLFIRYDGQGNPKDVLEAPGVWPGALSYGAMEQTGGDVVKISLPLVISRLIPMDPADLAVG